jgi:hypothetical protein
MESMEHEIRDHIGNKVAIAVEAVIDEDDSTNITPENDFQYDKVCDAIETAIMATNPVLGPDGDRGSQRKRTQSGGCPL